MGKQYHKWLAANKKETNNKAEKFLATIYPSAKIDEIKLLAKINTKDDLKQLAREHGYDDKQIKELLWNCWSMAVASVLITIWQIT